MKTYSTTKPIIQRLQGAILVPTNIVQTETNELEETTTQYCYDILRVTDTGQDLNSVAGLQSVLLSALNTVKKSKLDGGFFVGDTLFDSDNNARMAYVELAIQLSVNPSYETIWKAGNDVWLTMDATKYAEVKTAGELHMQTTFAWLAGKQAEIAGASTIADLIDIEI